MDGTTLRQIMGNFATGCTVLTLPGEPHGMTANAVTSVSLEPPLVLVCVDHETECHRRLSGDADGYALTILAEDQRDLGDHFADIEHVDRDPFEHRPTRTAVTGAPIFENGLAYLDCSVAAAHEAGDHTIYVGRVEAGDVIDGDGEPLLYFRGEWDRFD